MWWEDGEGGGLQLSWHLPPGLDQAVAVCITDQPATSREEFEIESEIREELKRLVHLPGLEAVGIFTGQGNHY